jgi:polysaccharide export outer membrane protein
MLVRTALIAFTLALLIAPPAAGGGFRPLDDSLILELELPAGGAWRVESEPGAVRVILPGGTPREKLPLPEDPKQLLQDLTWLEEAGSAVLVIELGAGVLSGVQSPGDGLWLHFESHLLGRETYLLGPGDVVDLQVYGEEELSGELTIDPMGEIGVELIGSVKASGRSADELAAVVRDALEEDYLANPLVTVEVKRYREQFVTVTGPVGRPGPVAVRGPTPLSRVIILAGGFVELAAGNHLTISRIDPDGAARSFRVSRPDLESGRSDPVVLPEDLVTVAPPELVYVDGEVGQSGSLFLTPGLTLLRALAMARGTTPWANESDVEIHREVGGHTVLEVYNLKKIRAHKQPDPELRPGDLIVVPRRFL